MMLMKIHCDSSYGEDDNKDGYVAVKMLMKINLIAMQTMKNAMWLSGGNIVSGG